MLGKANFLELRCSQLTEDRNEEITRVLLKVVDIGIRGGWAEFEDHPIQLPVPKVGQLKGVLDPRKEDASESQARLHNLASLVENYERLTSNRNGSPDSIGKPVEVKALARPNRK